MLYFSSKYAGDDFDPEEANYTYTELNPITIYGVVREISSEALVWKQYGLKETGAVEIITDVKHKVKFEGCTKIKIDSEEYQVYREGTGGRALIQARPAKLMRVILQRK